MTSSHDVTGARRRLLVRGGVPVRVEQDEAVRADEVEAAAARLRLYGMTIQQSRVAVPRCLVQVVLVFGSSQTPTHTAKDTVYLHGPPKRKVGTKGLDKNERADMWCVSILSNTKTKRIVPKTLHWPLKRAGKQRRPPPGR